MTDISWELRFVDAGTKGFIAVLDQLSIVGSQVPRIVVVPTNNTLEDAEELCRHARQAGLDCRTSPYPNGGGSTFVHPEEATPMVLFLLETDPELLSHQLMQLVDAPPMRVVAPITAHHSSRRALHLISIPKSGTHLLYELARAFGYHQGVNYAHEPRPGHWYCVEYSNSHTVARDFFVDTVRRAPFGNRHHPFMRTPALFIYRNPLDIWLSEANYYHLPGKTTFAAYLGRHDFAERLRILLGPDWLLGSLRERIGGFLPWLGFPNVAAVSFEELVGSQGGGDDTLQRHAIWSLQLKLHVGGRTADFAAKLFNRDSATFNEGRIGSYAERIPAHLLGRFFAEAQDILQELGYARTPGRLRAAANAVLRRLAPELLARREIQTISLHAATRRREPLVCDGNAFTETQIVVVTDFLGYNIIRLRGRFLGIPQSLGAVDLSGNLESLPEEIIVAGSTTRVKFRIMQKLNFQPRQ